MFLTQRDVNTAAEDAEAVRFIAFNTPTFSLQTSITFIFLNSWQFYLMENILTTLDKVAEIQPVEYKAVSVSTCLFHACSCRLKVTEAQCKDQIALERCMC